MQAAIVWFPAETCLSRGALVEDGDDIMVKCLHSDDPDVILTRELASAWYSECMASAIRAKAVKTYYLLTYIHACAY